VSPYYTILHIIISDIAGTQDKNINSLKYLLFLPLKDVLLLLLCVHTIEGFHLLFSLLRSSIIRNDGDTDVFYLNYPPTGPNIQINYF